MSIKLYRGDSTDFSDQRTITITIDAPFSLTGCTGSFSVQGVTKTFSVSSGTAIVSFTSAETATFALGECYGKLRIFDPSGRVKTVANEIPFDITQTVVTDETDEYAITVTLDSGDVNIEVVSTLGYIGEAPADGFLYGRKDGEWIKVNAGFAEKTEEVYSVTGFEELTDVDLSDCTIEDTNNLLGTLIATLKASGIIQ